MTTLVTTKRLFEESGIRKVLVVDDGFDSAPVPADLINQEDEWAIFFTDLNDTDVAMLAKLYDGFDDKEAAELQASDEFVQTLWDHRDELRKELVEPIFETYVNDTELDEKYLTVVRNLLDELGVEIQLSGRDFVGAAQDADLIVVDLFLGSAQSDADMRASIDGLAAVLSARVAEPPAIVLMSRSTRLSTNVDEFCERANIFASGFRYIAKRDLDKPARLEHLLRELARHRVDSLKLTRFLNAWRSGLNLAVDRTAADIRRLDLHDWAQIKDLLLTAEGVTTGSYILDVFDRVLMHEVESHTDTIEAAISLNELSDDSYPPMTAAGSKDTLSLLSKTLYQHDNRRALDSPNACPVAFGDVIGATLEVEALNGTIFEQSPNTVFVVLTPACDLQRQKAKRALLMAGTCLPVDAQSINYNGGKTKTAILTKPCGERVRVEWDRSHIAALTLTEIEALLAGTGVGTIFGRLRGESAIALQQELLSGLGRVGQMAPMPLTQQVAVKVFYPDANGDLALLTIGGKAEIQAVLFVGRETKKKIVRVPFDSEHRFELLDALTALGNNDIHPHSVNKIERCRSPNVIDFLLSKGIVVDTSKSGAQDWKVQIDEGLVSLGRAVYEGSATEAINTPQAIRTAGLVFQFNPT